jgi:hypothetical protein
MISEKWQPVFGKDHAQNKAVKEMISDHVGDGAGQ